MAPIGSTVTGDRMCRDQCGSLVCRVYQVRSGFANSGLHGMTTDVTCQLAEAFCSAHVEIMSEQEVASNTGSFGPGVELRYFSRRQRTGQTGRLAAWTDRLRALRNRDL